MRHVLTHTGPMHDPARCLNLPEPLPTSDVPWKGTSLEVEDCPATSTFSMSFDLVVVLRGMTSDQGLMMLGFLRLYGFVTRVLHPLSRTLATSSLHHHHLLPANA